MTQNPKRETKTSNVYNFSILLRNSIILQSNSGCKHLTSTERDPLQADVINEKAAALSFNLFVASVQKDFMTPRNTGSVSLQLLKIMFFPVQALV